MAKKVINKSIETKKAVGTDIKKLKMLITVVDRSKSLFYMDLLEQFEVNMQTVIYGKGTAGTEMLSLLGLRESDKAIIISFVREDMIQDIKETLSEKFEKILITVSTSTKISEKGLSSCHKIV